MNGKTLSGTLKSISDLISVNRDYLIELDQQNGDGDLGISMSAGFRAVADYLSGTEETDLGKLLMKCGSVFNEAAPSSLGTILAMGMMGMAKVLKGKEDASLSEIVLALEGGIRSIMEKAKSKPGEKTIMDALCPAVKVLKNAAGSNESAAWEAAAQAATEGSESTRTMKPVHGRAAYYGEKSIGILDGGSVVGKLIFQGICDYRSGA
ncbi:MAG: dihydroxyacetone kinase subunit L [Spirochaetaceae bacterium]|jgi:dihydroxyacetone kinase|nr:dihydroxyacetone kinase subunit L [Spirochaetaceae bacterium]